MLIKWTVFFTRCFNGLIQGACPCHDICIVIELQCVAASCSVLQRLAVCCIRGACPRHNICIQGYTHVSARNSTKTIAHARNHTCAHMIS